MTALFEPFTLRELTIPNRVWMPPMCQYSAAPEGPEAGVPADWHFAHYAARAAGGTGLIIVEATAVSPQGRISPYDLGIWNDTQVEAFRRITRFLTAQGTVPAIQLAHAGRKASTDRPWKGGAPVGPDEHGWQPVAPSPLAFDDRHPVPDELTTGQIKDVVEQFAAAARRALAAGFEIAEIHGAHGYLINEFLSPHSNHRTDAYGGSYENRTRFALEVVDAVREVWPTTSRCSSVSRRPNGSTTAAGPRTTRSVSRPICEPTASTCWTSPPAATPPGSASPRPPATRCPSPPGCGTRRPCPSPPSDSSPTSSRPRRSWPTARRTRSCWAASCCAPPPGPGTRHGNSAVRCGCRTSTTGRSDPAPRKVRQPAAHAVPLSVNAAGAALSPP